MARASSDPGVIVIDSVQAIPELKTASAGTRMAMYSTIKRALDLDLVSVVPSRVRDIETVAFEHINQALQLSDWAKEQDYTVDLSTRTAFVQPNILYLSRLERKAYGYVDYDGQKLPGMVCLEHVGRDVINKLSAGLARGEMPKYAPCAIVSVNLYADGSWGWGLWSPVDTKIAEKITCDPCSTRNDLTSEFEKTFGIDNPAAACTRAYYKVDWDRGWVQRS
jgi:hypothetical protein